MKPRQKNDDVGNSGGRVVSARSLAQKFHDLSRRSVGMVGPLVGPRVMEEGLPHSDPGAHWSISSFWGGRCFAPISDPACMHSSLLLFIQLAKSHHSMYT